MRRLPRRRGVGTLFGRRALDGSPVPLHAVGEGLGARAQEVLAAAEGNEQETGLIDVLLGRVDEHHAPFRG